MKLHNTIMPTNNFKGIIARKGKMAHHFQV